MKKHALLWLLFFAALSIPAFWSNASGPGQVQGLDRTGGPLSTGFCATSGCHNGGNYNPSVAITVLDGDEAVSTYQPGQMYSVRVRITAGTGTPDAYGFQAVALTDEDQQAGTLATGSSSQQLVQISNRTYVEHSSPSNSNTFTFNWTAPAAGVGQVGFYAAGNAVNGNGVESGDAAATASLLLNETIVGTREQNQLPVTLRITPNPVHDVLRLVTNSAVSGEFEVRLSDLNGRRLLRRTLRLNSGENSIELPVAGLAAGHYVLTLSDGRRMASTSLLKQ